MAPTQLEYSKIYLISIQKVKPEHDKQFLALNCKSDVKNDYNKEVLNADSSNISLKDFATEALMVSRKKQGVGTCQMSIEGSLQRTLINSDMHQCHDTSKWPL